MRTDLRILERRGIPGVDLELRETGDGQLQFAGYAAVWDAIYDMGWFEERVLRGTFAKSISEAARPGYESTRDIGFLYSHDPATVMARTSNGSLRLEEDAHGLRVEADLDPADTDVARLASKLRSRNVYQMSHARVTLKAEWDEEREPTLRTVTEAQLWETSPVTFPASPQTQADLRAALQSLEVDARALGLDLGTLLEAREDAPQELNEAINVLLAHAEGRAVNPEQAQEARRAVEALRRLLAAEPEHLQPPDGPEHLHSLRPSVAKAMYSHRTRTKESV